MAEPTTRTTFIDYIKRRLGHPVIEVNVDENQMEESFTGRKFHKRMYFISRL